MKFEFATAQQIIFGRGSIQRLASILPTGSQRCLLVMGRHFTGWQEQIPLPTGLECLPYLISGEPNAETVEKGAQLARQKMVDVIIAIGGGSVLDAGKAIAMLAANAGTVLDYIEVVGKGQPISSPSLPLIAIPTTAGTGSEVTRNAVISLPEHQVKASLRAASMLPYAALVDPHLTDDLPPAITASTGMDALTQVIEPYLSSKANDFVDQLCLPAVRMGLKALPTAFHQPDHTEARDQMAYVSLMGGLALANAGLGAVHGFAAALGGMFPLAHGVICACLLPAVVEENYRALTARDPENVVIDKYKILADGQSVTSWIESLYQLKSELRIPGLMNMGVSNSHFAEIVSKAARASSMKANPIQLNEEELTHILAQCV